MQFSKSLKAALLALTSLVSIISNLPAEASSGKTNLANPQEGFLAACRFVRESYVDSNLAGQDWSAWEKKASDIQTSEEEFDAIKTMMGSLHDPYTRPLHIVDKTNANAPSMLVEAVNSRLIDGNVGYIKISSFASPFVASSVKDDIASLAKAKAIIIDLRGNQGGLMSNALEIADMLLPGGNVVTTVSRDGTKTYTAAAEPLTEQQLLVLVDDKTASASEILTGALKDNHRATVIGTKTFGKGLVQEVAVLPGVELRCTVSKYLTPAGNDINKVGISPDISTTGEDALSAALSLVNHG